MDMGPCLGASAQRLAAAAILDWSGAAVRLVWLFEKCERLAGLAGTRVSDAAQYTRGQGWSDLTHEMKRFALALSVSLTASDLEPFAFASLYGWQALRIW